MGTQLDAAGVAHSGIRIDCYADREFIRFDDPDGCGLNFIFNPRNGHNALSSC
jgi:hypothetical protein